MLWQILIAGLWILLCPGLTLAHSGHNDSSGPSLQSPPMPGMNHADHATDAVLPVADPEPANGEMPREGTSRAAEGDMYGLGAGADAQEHAGHDAEPSLGGSELLGDGLSDLAPDAAVSEGAHAEHAMGNMEPHVTPSEHTLISTDVKGYGVAVGITLVCGLVFGVLSRVRPFE